MKRFNCMVQTKFRSVVSLAVAVIILLSAIFVGVTPSIFVKADDDQYVIKFAKGSTQSKSYFGQQVSLEAGNTYTFSYRYTGPDASYLIRIDDGSWVDIAPDSISYNNEWFEKYITFTVPADNTSIIWVGIQGIKNTIDVYYYDFKLYDTDTPSVNILKDQALIEGGSNIDGSIWKRPSNNALTSGYFSKTTLKAVGGIDIFKRTDADKYAVKLEPNSTGQPVFGQTVSLKTGKTYVFSNYYLPATDAVQWISHGNNIDNKIEYEVIDDAEWSKQGAKFTVPETATDDPNIEGNKLVWVGFRGHKASTELYYYGFELYDVENPELNLLKDPLLMDSTFNNAWKSPYGSNISAKFSKVNLKSIGGMDIFKKSLANESLALKLEPETTGMPWFGQWVTLERGKTYIFSNCYLPDTDVNHRIYYRHADNQYDGSDLEGDMVYDPLWSRYGTRFTVPADAPENANGKTFIWVGLRGYKTSETVYYYDFKLYDVENPETNILRDAQLLENNTSFNNAVWKTPGDNSVSSKYSEVTLESIGGEDIFKIEQPKGALALKLDANVSGMPFFGQNVSLKAGKTYVFSNYYLPYTAPNQMACYAGTENQIDCEIIDDIEWSNRSIKFTVPNDAQDDPEIKGNKLIWVGFRGNKSNKPLYYYDIKLYDVDDPSVNILKDGKLENNGWNLDKSVWVSPYGDIKNSYSKVELESVGGIDIFKNPMASEPMVLALAPETTGMPFFGQWVTVEKGKTYVFSNCYLPGTDTVQNVYLNDNGKELTDCEVTYDSKLSKRSMKFTVPKGANDKDLQTRIWVGIRGFSYDGYLYFYNFELYDVENPNVNIMRDSTLRENDSLINTTLWKSPYNTEIKDSYAKVSLELLGGEDVFVRTGDVGPKMMYYTRTNRGPNHETYGCFMISIPEELRVSGQNYVLQFDARSTKGIALNNFRCGAIAPELALDENNRIAPASIDGYKYTFNLRFTEDKSKRLSIMIFVPEDAEGYISNLYIYKADKNFKKISDRDLFKSSYADFSQFEVGDYVELYSKSGGCIGTETGKLESVPEYFFDTAPNVEVPSGDKMMSYASVWGAGTIVIKLPHTIEKGSIDGKNYVVSLTIRPTKGRDPSKFHSTGINGEHVQVYPNNVDGYKYTFNLSERYDFSLVLEFPADCEGYISNLEMYEADADFKPINNVNLSTAFGKGGKFADVKLQQGMEWEGITFNGGFVNTFVDTRALKKELKDGTLGNYSVSGGIWPIPKNYFVAKTDDTWADAYMNNLPVESGTVIGKLENISGEAIAGYTVVLKSMQNADDLFKAISDKNGEFRFDSVHVGGYEVSIVTTQGAEVLGDMFLWVEENKDTVNLSLVYSDQGVDMSYPEGDSYYDDSFTEENYVEETLPEENNNLVEENNVSTENNSKNDTEDKDYTLLIIIISSSVVVVLGLVTLFIVIKKKKKVKS